MRRMAMVTILVVGLAGAAAASEHSTFVPLQVAPLRADGTAGCASAALLNLPPAWQAGDALVVMLTVAPLHDAGRDPLVAALLHEHAAVLEVTLGAPMACPDERAASMPAPAGAAETLRGALRAARDQARAGLVIAVGYGPGAGAAIAATAGPGVAGYAAMLALGDGPPVFRAGAASASDAAPWRRDLLCDALLRSGTVSGAAAGLACTDGLGGTLPQVSAQAAR